MAAIGKMWTGMVTTAMKNPDVKVNVVRVKGLTDVLKGLAGWGVPLGMIAGASARVRFQRRASRDALAPRARAIRPGASKRRAFAAGWMVWPALTTDFKVNTLGVEKAPPSGQKFEFEKEAVGENPEMSAGNVKG